VVFRVLKRKVFFFFPQESMRGFTSNVGGSSPFFWEFLLGPLFPIDLKGPQRLFKIRPKSSCSRSLDTKPGSLGKLKGWEIQALLMEIIKEGRLGYNISQIESAKKF